MTPRINDPKGIMQTVRSSFDRRQFLSASATVLGTAGAALLLGGCGETQGSVPKPSDIAPATDAALTGLTIKAAGAGSGSSGVMRQALKLASIELGGEVTLADMAQGTALLSIRNSSVESAMMSWVNLAQARDQGVPAVAIAPAWASHASIVVRSDSPYQTVADLKGKRLGSNERTTGVYSEGRSALISMGLDIEKDFQLKPLGDSAVLTALYKKGEFEAILVSEPSVSQTLADGGSRELLQVGSSQARLNEGRFTPVNCWGVRQDWLDNYDDSAVQKLFLRANELAKTSRKPYDIAASASKMSDSAADLFYQRFPQLVVSAFTDQNLQDAQSTLDDAVKEGLIKKSYDVNDLVYRP